MLDFKIMTPFKKYWTALSPQEKNQLASDLGTSFAYLSQIANGDRDPGHKLAKKMREKTGLSLKQIRPDIYGELRA